MILQELEDAKISLLVQVDASAVMEQFLKMGCALIQALVQVATYISTFINISHMAIA